jgi:phosphoglycerate dehydrogenase-like enzyme
MIRQLFSPAAVETLRSLGETHFNPDERQFTADELASRIGGFDILLTGWRSPRLTEAILQNAQRLRLIAHSAGSVKFMLDQSTFDRGIRVTSAAMAMAQPVAEMSVLLAMLMLRPVHRIDEMMRAGRTWPEMKAAALGEELGGQTIGLVGAGNIGRRVIPLFKAFGAKVLLYDPTIDVRQAAEWGVTLAPTLDEMLPHCRILSLHAPVLPETHRMIGARQLALLREGTILINTARAWLVDNDALLAELQSGRLRAAVDVFDEEPLPPDSPWRRAPNALLLSHIAATTQQCFHRQGDITVSEIDRFLRGQPLEYEIKPEMLATMA